MTDKNRGLSLIFLAWAARGVTLIETADIGALLQDPRLAQRACRHATL